MTGLAVTSAAVQLAGGIALSPLLPGLIQHWKARLQGRPGPSPLQPYRELRRLQTGSLAVYVAYLIALVMAVLIAGRIGLLG